MSLKYEPSCREKMAHSRQSRPDSGFGVYETSLEKKFPLRSERDNLYMALELYIEECRSTESDVYTIGPSPQ